MPKQDTIDMLFSSIRSLIDAVSFKIKANEILEDMESTKAAVDIAKNDWQIGHEQEARSQRDFREAFRMLMRGDLDPSGGGGVTIDFNPPPKSDVPPVEPSRPENFVEECHLPFKGLKLSMTIGPEHEGGQMFREFGIFQAANTPSNNEMASRVVPAGEYSSAEPIKVSVDLGKLVACGYEEEERKLRYTISNRTCKTAFAATELREAIKELEKIKPGSTVGSFIARQEEGLKIAELGYRTVIYGNDAMPIIFIEEPKNQRA